ncbi:hypothetical protein [Methylomonas albis]|nr:hypothetical protein [Methylomonas albis]
MPLKIGDDRVTQTTQQPVLSLRKIMLLPIVIDVLPIGEKVIGKT